MEFNLMNVMCGIDRDFALSGLGMFCPSNPRRCLGLSHYAPLGRVSHLAFKGGYIDAWGRGTLKIAEACRTAGLPEPEMRESDGGFLVMLRDKTKAAADAPSTDQVTDQVKMMLGFLQNSAQGALAIMEHLNLKHRTFFRENYINPALEAGYIEMTQPDSPNNPAQKYRLTAKGLAVLTGKKSR